ncbi:2640_t:CDS:2 [Entrophospora sp. SA101]|nr:2640_t:CDS:2 [Entrophospora sp. SA101]
MSLDNNNKNYRDIILNSDDDNTFIPIRNNGDLYADFQRREVVASSVNSKPINRKRKSQYNASEEDQGTILFTFQSSKRQKANNLIDHPYRNAYSTTPFSREIEELLSTARKGRRIFDQQPYQMLAFCNELMLKDDFYLNVVDWSIYNILSLGLENMIYLWNTATKCGTQLAVGTVDGKVQIWDVVTSTKIRDFTGHSSRVGALAWNNNVLSTGGADRIIYQKGDQLASGGNANELYVWEKSNDHEPALKLEKHKAAVRALSWSPHDRNILVSGGGHLDRQICFWNTLDGRSLGVHNSKSQVCNLQWSPNANEIVSTQDKYVSGIRWMEDRWVCNLQWSPNANEIVSTHGWWRNDVIVWQYPSMKKLATLKGHTYRVLYFSLAPDGEDIVTGAGGDDNTLRFWKIFNTPRDKSLKKPDSVLKLDRLIR